MTEKSVTNDHSENGAICHHQVQGSYQENKKRFWMA